MNSANHAFSNGLDEHRAGNLLSAIEHYSSALEIDPALVEAHSNMAAANTALGNYDKAETGYRKALELKPGDPDTLVNLGNLLQNRGELDEARTFYSTAIESNPANPTALANLANIQLKLGQFEQAIENYRAAAELAPGTSWYFNNMAAALTNLGRLDEAVEAIHTALQSDPENADAYNNLGTILRTQALRDEALEAFDKAIAMKPDWPPPYSNRAITLGQMARTDEAKDYFRKAIGIDSEYFNAHKGLASVLSDNGETADARTELIWCLERDPDNGEILFLLANVDRAERDFEAAERNYRKALETGVEAPEVLSNLATTLFDLRRYEDGIEIGERALEAVPEYAHALNCMANCYMSLGQLEEACAHYARAMKSDPEFAVAANNAGTAWRRLGELEKAEASHKKALEIDPELAAGFNGLGLVYQARYEHEQSLEWFEKGLELDPGDVEILNNMAVTYQSMSKYGEAVRVYNQAIDHNADIPEIYFNLGSLLQLVGRFDESVPAFKKALEIRPDYHEAIPFITHSMMQLCVWENLETAFSTIVDNISEEIEIDAPISASPFSMLSMPVPPQFRLAGARQVSNNTRISVGAAQDIKYFDYSERGEKLKIGYLSPDFKTHSLGMAFLELLKGHSHDAYELYGYSVVTDKWDDVTDEFIKTFDKFTDVATLPTRDAAKVINDDGIDILVDLAGHTRGMRIDIMAFRPAPIQAHYLGYGYTLGADYIPYLISDEVAIPPEMAAYCSEDLVMLPDGFMIGTKGSDSDKVFTRTECDLPEDGIVYVNFNGHYKFDPMTFAIWMRLMRRTPDSVLWLKTGSDVVVANLRKEAETRGVDPDRLVFAKIIDHADHFSRLKLADIGLDSYFHAGGVTTTDALWAGVPVVTIAGETPSGRTGATLLKNVGMPELIAENLEQYEKCAWKLSADPEYLQSIKNKLWQNRETEALFDAPRLAGQLETAYSMMWDNYAAGNPPTAINVPPRSTSD